MEVIEKKKTAIRRQRVKDKLINFRIIFEKVEDELKKR
jgi:hypothetical protein